MRDVPRASLFEMLCVVVVLLAIAALVVWLVFHHGGAQGAAGPF